MHDLGLIVQFLFMISVVTGLYSVSNQQLPGMTRITFIIGVVTIVAMAANLKINQWIIALSEK